MSARGKFQRDLELEARLLRLPPSAEVRELIDIYRMAHRLGDRPTGSLSQWRKGYRQVFRHCEVILRDMLPASSA